MKIKQKLIDEHINKPFSIGEKVQVKGLGIKDKNQWGNVTEIISMNKDGVIIKEYNSDRFVPFEDIKKHVGDIGIDPFQENIERPPRNVNFQLDSIYHLLFRDNSQYKTEKGFLIKNLNWNPFVEMNNKKEYYQRDFVWELEDKQLLIDSIYNNITCGSIVVRHRSFKWLDKRENEDECFFVDIVDGKQRMKTIHEFINDEFKDSKGRFYSDFSNYAQRKFLNNQLFAYFEFDENADDESVIKQFLKVNFTGKPQSKEHIEYVQKILNNR